MSGYLAEEKLQIARKYLVPKQLTEHGLRADELQVSDAALQEMVDRYTHESGVRGLEKQIAKVARVTAKKMALGQEFPKEIGPEHLKEYLGLPTAYHDDVKGNEGPGVVTGLAWTEMGGEVLFVEDRRNHDMLHPRIALYQSHSYTDLPDEEEKEAFTPRIVRTKKFVIRPMSEEEAMLQMEMLGHSFFVFENAETGDVNVLYVRKDGNYGLIERACMICAYCLEHMT